MLDKLHRGSRSLSLSLPLSLYLSHRLSALSDDDYIGIVLLALPLFRSILHSVLLSVLLSITGAPVLHRPSDGVNVCVFAKRDRKILLFLILYLRGGYEKKKGRSIPSTRLKSLLIPKMRNRIQLRLRFLSSIFSNRARLQFGVTIAFPFVFSS